VGGAVGRRGQGSNRAPFGLALALNESLSSLRLGAEHRMCKSRLPDSRSVERATLSQRLVEVRRAALRDRGARFTALLHHVDVDRLRAAYRALNPRAATGVDGVTWQEYGRDLEGNLEDLHARLRRGAYRVKPSRRTYIPKPDGRQRPLGIAALEDKIVQRGTVEVLNAIYETDFLGFSYGFGLVAASMMRWTRSRSGSRAGGWAGCSTWISATTFPASTSRGLEGFLGHRIADRRVLRLIQKWLKAGVIEDGKWSQTERGTPQGASVSTFLASVYLHYVFDPVGSPVEEPECAR
jgi:RNA-directed DNA polymerase